MIHRTILVRLGRLLKTIWIRAFTTNIITGKNVIIDYGTVIINNSNRIILGDNVYIRSVSRGYQAGMPFSSALLIDVKGGTISIGNNSRINGAYIHAQQSIEIGQNCLIASGVNILDSNGHDVYSANRTKGRDEPQKITIGSNVWIGLNSIILKGTVIGDNSVVAAGSVVKGTFPENSIIMGNPASIVKTITVK